MQNADNDLNVRPSVQSLRRKSTFGIGDSSLLHQMSAQFALPKLIYVDWTFILTYSNSFQFLSNGFLYLRFYKIIAKSSTIAFWKIL